MLILLAGIMAVATSCTVPPEELALQVALPYEVFDAQGSPYGWRFLVDSKCTDAALSLLARYGAANKAHLPNDQQLELAFHSGQALAFSGRERESISFFERATNSRAAPEWQTYVAATLAFLTWRYA